MKFINTTGRNSSKSYLCDKDENGAPTFYDGEIGFRLCKKDCNLQGSNIWLYDCLPCCQKHESGVNVSIAVGCTIVGLLLVVIGGLIYWKIRQSRNNNAEHTSFYSRQNSAQSDTHTQYVLSPLITTNTNTGAEQTEQQNHNEPAPSVTTNIPIPSSDTLRQGEKPIHQ